MTKSFNNFTSSSNKPNKKKNEKSDLVVDADKLMDDLNMEEFQNVLDQVVDYTLPDSKKSLLVQRLNQDAKEDNNCLEAAFFSSDKSQKQATDPKFKNLNNKKSPKLDNMASSSDATTSNTTTAANKNVNSSSSLNDKNASLPAKDSHLQKLQNFCDSFDSVLNNCNSLNNYWDPTQRVPLNNSNNLTNSNNLNSKLNGTLTSKSSSSPESSASINNSSSLTNSSDSSQPLIHNIHHNHWRTNLTSSDNSSKSCDILNCDTCRLHHSRSTRPIYVSNTAGSDELSFEMKDYRGKAELVEYTKASHSFLKYADLKDNIETSCDETKLVKPFKAEKYSNSSLESSSYYDHHPICQGNQLKLNTVNTQFAKRCLDESETSRNYSNDCLNISSNLADGRSHAKLLNSTSDGYISSMNTYYDTADKSYSKKVSNLSSIQTNGKLESHLKKRKKPEKKLTQECPGYVGYKDIAYLTDYITGTDNKSSANESMRNTTIHNNKEMNVKKKDKKELNAASKDKKKSAKDTTSSSVNNSNLDKTDLNNVNIINNSNDQQANDLNQTNGNDQTIANDKNNNNLNTATNDIIPNSSTTNSSLVSSNNSSHSAIKKGSNVESTAGKTAVNVSNVTNGENNMNNLNSNGNGSQAKGNNNKQAADRVDKRNEKNNNSKVSSSSSSVNQSRKSSANLEIINNSVKLNNQASSSKNQSSTQRSNNSKDNKANNKNSTALAGIVSNGSLHAIDSMYIVSDSEVPDQEGDFKVVKYKQLRRKKQKKGSNQEDQIKLNGNELSPSNGQSNNSGKSNKREQAEAVPNPATARGYESESDYCAVEGRKRGLQREVKRDVLLDNNTDGNNINNNSRNKNKKKKKNSISNSDSDSINSSTEESTLSNQPLPNNTKMNAAINNQAFTQNESAGLGPFTPTIINSNIVPYSKISYAAITKMSYPTSQINSNHNLITNNSNGNNSTTPTIETKKENNRNRNKNSSNSNDKNRNHKSITNSNEQKAEASRNKDNKSNNNQQVNTNKKMIDDDKHLDAGKQQTKLASSSKTPKLNKNDSNEEKAVSTATELSTDFSRTDSIDLNNPSYISSKSNSFNSNSPAVIMLDNKNTNQDTTFTFGFFDENAQLQNNVENEENEGQGGEQQFNSINVNSVNFISNNKEESSTKATSDQSKNGVKDDAKKQNVVDKESTQTTYKNKPMVDNKSETVRGETISTPISISAIMKSSSINNILAASNSSNNLSTQTINNNNENRPICEGTYIMESSKDNSSLAIHDSITKKVEDSRRLNDQYKRYPYVNEHTSFNLTKFKEKQTSPFEQQQHQQNNRYEKTMRSDFTCNVAYIQAVNYVRRAYEDAKNHSHIYKEYKGPSVSFKLVIERVHDCN